MGMSCRPGGVVVDGDEVDEEGSAADEGGEEEGGHQHLSYPDLVPTSSYIYVIRFKGGLNKIMKNQMKGNVGIRIGIIFGRQNVHRD